MGVWCKPYNLVRLLTFPNASFRPVPSRGYRTWEKTQWLNSSIERDGKKTAVFLRPDQRRFFKRVPGPVRWPGWIPAQRARGTIVPGTGILITATEVDLVAWEFFSETLQRSWYTILHNYEYCVAIYRIFITENICRKWLKFCLGSCKQHRLYKHWYNWINFVVIFEKFFTKLLIFLKKTKLI